MIIEGKVEFHSEDGACAAIAEVVDVGSDVFVRIQEWHDDPQDNTFVPTLRGKRVRIIIEEMPNGA